MPITHVARVVVKGQMHGSECNNVLHFGSNGAIPPDVTASLNQLVTDILDCVRTTLLPALSSDFKIVSVSAQMLHPELSDQVVVAGEATDVGALGSALPSFNSYLVSLKTGKGGRSKRGRFYISGVPETGQQESKLTTGQLALIVAFAACMIGKFITNVVDPGWRIGVLSRKLTGEANGNETAGFTPATTLIPQQVIATMRSRKLGLGI